MSSKLHPLGSVPSIPALSGPQQHTELSTGCFCQACNP